ncbi:MAG: hypothetical protein WC114_02415 [Smithellaceae bacterium]
MKEWPVCLTCRFAAARGQADGEQKTTGISKGSGGRASSMKIATISIDRTLLGGNMVTISSNSQGRFS